MLGLSVVLFFTVKLSVAKRKSIKRFLVVELEASVGELKSVFAD